MKDKIQGTVKFFNEAKGYGFIKPNNSEKDVFVHVSQLDKIGGSLQDGQPLLFNTIEGRKGLEAINIEKIESSIY